MRLVTISANYCQGCKSQTSEDRLQNVFLIRTQCSNYTATVLNGHLQLQTCHMTSKSGILSSPPVGIYHIEQLKLPEDDSHFFRMYSCPLNMKAVESLSAKGSPCCTQLKERLFAVYLVMQERLVRCLHPNFLKMMIEVSLRSLREMSLIEKLDSALEVMY